MSNMQSHPNRPDLHIGDRVSRGAVHGIPGVLPESFSCEGTIVGFREVQMFGPLIATVIRWDDGMEYEHIHADFQKIEPDA
jgi:hypothetical protein